MDDRPWAESGWPCLLCQTPDGGDCRVLTINQNVVHGFWRFIAACTVHSLGVLRYAIPEVPYSKGTM